MVNEFTGLEEKRSNIKIEFVAGLTTFLTMAYIIFVNPSILSLEGIELTGVERMDKQALIAVTCLVSGIASIIVGIVAKAPHPHVQGIHVAAVACHYPYRKTSPYDLAVCSNVCPYAKQCLCAARVRAEPRDHPGIPA